MLLGSTKITNVCQPVQYVPLLVGWAFLNVKSRAFDMVPTGLFIQDDVNKYYQHLVLLQSSIMSVWNLPCNEQESSLSHQESSHVLCLKTSKSISPRGAIGQVQKFAGRWIITGLEITMKESIRVFFHSLIILQISCYIINLSTTMPLFSSHFTSGQSASDVHTEPWIWPHWRVRFMWWSEWPSVEYDLALLSCSSNALMDCCCLWFVSCQYLKGPWNVPTSAPSLCSWRPKLRWSDFLEGYTPQRTSSLHIWNAYPSDLLKEDMAYTSAITWSPEALTTENLNPKSSYVMNIKRCLSYPLLLEL